MHLRVYSLKHRRSFLSTGQWLEIGISIALLSMNTCKSHQFPPQMSYSKRKKCFWDKIHSGTHAALGTHVSTPFVCKGPQSAFIIRDLLSDPGCPLRAGITSRVGMEHGDSETHGFIDSQQDGPCIQGYWRTGNDDTYVVFTTCWALF